MSRLKDVYLSDVPPGTLVFPSSSARMLGNGGYMLEGLGSNRSVADIDTFPAIVVDPRVGTLVTPTGMKNLARYSLVSMMK